MGGAFGDSVDGARHQRLRQLLVPPFMVIERAYGQLISDITQPQLVNDDWQALPPSVPRCKILPSRSSCGRYLVSMRRAFSTAQTTEYAAGINNLALITVCFFFPTLQRI